MPNQETTKDYLEAVVEGVYVTSTGAEAVMLLSTEEWGDFVLPIWIGMAEALSIQKAMGQTDFPRPLTHDLLVDILERLNATIEKVTIDALVDHTYTATIYLKDNRTGSQHYIDARPSDAVAVALRVNAPIFVANHLKQYTVSINELLGKSNQEEGEEGKSI
ncbi:bifunctional nuclease family protein [Caldivirga maquilingensis]|uniref:BFN domain-containing protein n=2 Tax=Caldivirga TaxID=76886 RepID=A8M9K9_CALMQ|nr:bifunctional nuclease family protein [Caldivirga maquilingensis]ABW00890.1 protein of unknown function DUF151 [Caldivirga maquilingensis IC-167]